MKTKRVRAAKFSCSGNSDDVLDVVDDGEAVGFVMPDALSVYVAEPHLTGLIEHLKKVRKRIYKRAIEGREELHSD